MTTYFTLLTPTGLAKIANAQLTQNTVAINQVAVGDSNGVNYTPTGNETALKKERWRGGVASVNIDTTNPNWIVVEAVIPSSVGGFTLREVALYDVDGDMIAIGNYPDTYKPLASDGSTMDLVLRTIIEVSNASSITLRIDPNVIVASRKYVDDKVSSVNSSVTNLQTALTAHLGQSNPNAHEISNINGLQTNLDGKADKQQEDWIPVVYEAGWSDIGGIWAPLQYYKDSFGVVRMSGASIKSGSGGVFITRLPVGYRPSKQIVGFAGAGLGVVVKNDGFVSFNGEGSTVTIQLSFKATI